MKRLVLSGNKYNDDDDVCVYGAAVTRYILYLFIIIIFFSLTVEERAGDV